MSKKSIPLSPKTVEIIKIHLAARHITHEEFANQLKITPRTLNNWLSGRTAIEFNKLDRLIKTLGVGLEELFGDEIPQDYVFHQETARVAWWLYKSGVATIFHNAYRKVAELFMKRVSFVLLPKKGFFQAFEHNIKNGKNYYFEFWLISETGIEEAKFTISFTIANIIRIDYGEIFVKPDCVEIKQYYQPPDYQVKRPTECLAKVVTWFDELSHTFVVVSDKPFKIIEKGRVSEEKLHHVEDVAIFWKHFFFHADT
jgi:transcriptional regulator with XRE-family HTH domain